ncbi:MAG: tyrosine-type recombinase/integrase, partial [Solimonas sp.]
MTNALVVNHDPIELVAPLTALPQRSQPRPTNLLASPISDVALTDEALLSAWLRAKAAGANPRSKHTLTQYRSEATRWAWYAFHVAQTAITQWTREHVIDFLDYLHQVPSDHILSNEARRGRKLKPVDPAWRPFRAQPSRASIAQIQVILRGFYSWLLANGHLLVHPMAGINAPKRRQRTRKHKHFTPAECSKILDAVSRFELKTHQQRRQWARARFAFVCLARTGLRPFELAAAKMSDITRHAAVIHAQAAEVWVLSVEHGKGDKQ